MNTVVNPSKEKVIEFCKILEAQLLAAIDRGANVEIATSQMIKDVRRPDYGYTVVDALYVGAKFKAQFREKGF